MIRDTMMSLCGCLLLGLSAIGCGGGPERPDNMPPLYPVQIKLLQEDAPLAGASVRLVPDGASSSWYTGGTTDDQGIAEVHTHGKFSGAPAGKYKLVVTKFETPSAASTTLENLNQPTSKDATYDLVDPKFGNPAKTTLELEVTESQAEHEFDLGPAVRVKRQGPPS